jgi:ribosomal protein L11 methyltransferase
VGTYKLSVPFEARDLAWRVAGALSEALDPPPGAVSVFERPGTPDWIVEAYFEEEPDRAILAAVLERETGQRSHVATLEAVPEINWVAVSQAALPPVEAGRFTVHGSHDRDRVRHRRYCIEIDAGEAFGTAHHATTYGCLLAIDALARQRPPRRVLDLGCGSGVLAIAAARVWPKAHIAASDIDPTSVAVARENALRNGVVRRIDFRARAGLGPAHRAGSRRYELIASNILARPLKALACDIARAMRPGGRAILSGLLVREAASVMAAYVAAGFSVKGRREIEGWAILDLERR